jgi:hypothetical protein
LKPGGRAVFSQLRPLTQDYARKLARAVGTPGRLKEFWLTTGLLYNAGIAPSSRLARASQRFDSAILRRFPAIRSLASHFVWESRKES